MLFRSHQRVRPVAPLAVVRADACLGGARKSDPMTRAARTVPSPVGPLLLETDGTSLTRPAFIDRADADGAVESRTGVGQPDHPVLLRVKEQLDGYFLGTLRAFDLPLAPEGSDFQRQVWEELCRIPFGATASYGDIAVRLGLPVSASRAVGLANGANPIAIVIPCHRVIGADGTLVGYGGGLRRKRFLLDLESPTVQDALFPE